MSATGILNGPFVEEWTPPDGGATAAELAHVLARHDDETLGRWHDQLATAVNELLRVRICAESDPKERIHDAWGVGDPLVALVRAVALLARRRPTARSATAQLLVDLLG